MSVYWLACERQGRGVFTTFLRQSDMLHPQTRSPDPACGWRRAALKLCPSCGGHCRAIVQEKVEKKRKSRLGSWLGKVTGKMTDRLMRTRVW